MKIVALIPARGGSKRVINKNIRQINGVPLVGWAIKQAYDSELIEEVYVSTDDEIIAEVSRNYGARVPFMRPSELAQDYCGDYEVFRHFVDWYSYAYGFTPDIIVQVRATAPIRNAEDIDKAIQMLIDHEEADSLRSVSEPHQTPYKMWKIDEENHLERLMTDDDGKAYDGPTQGVPKTYGQDGVIDIIRSKTLTEKNSISGNVILGYTQHKFTWDLDSEMDVRFVTMYMQNMDFNSFNSKMDITCGKLGIIQGRLTESNGVLQCFPKDWKSEFTKARQAGYNYIELIRDREYNIDNPLWQDDFKEEEIINMELISGVAVRHICDDYILNCKWTQLTVNQYDTLLLLLFRANQLGIRKIIYPLMENADIKEKESFDACAKYMRQLARHSKVLHIELLLEITGNKKLMKEMLEAIGEQNVSICIDTGNLLAAGEDMYEIIKNMQGMYSLVHIKDRDINGKNVPLGKGIVDFTKVKELLIKQQYRGEFTMETDRGLEPVITAIENIKFLKGI